MSDPNDLSSSNLNSSTDDDDNRRLRLKHVVENDERSSGSSGTSRQSMAASLRDFAESMMRMEVMELEMMKAREAARIEAENRRVERESELTQLVLKTQLQIASFVAARTGDRKRKRGEEDDDEVSLFAQRQGAMLLSLLQLNLAI